MSACLFMQCTYVCMRLVLKQCIVYRNWNTWCENPLHWKTPIQKHTLLVIESHRCSCVYMWTERKKWGKKHTYKFKERNSVSQFVHAYNTKLIPSWKWNFLVCFGFCFFLFSLYLWVSECVLCMSKEENWPNLYWMNGIFFCS